MDNLADYTSSDEELQPQHKKRAVSPSSNHSLRETKKKRKLPEISPSLISPSPIDDPSKHQGRIRTQPHVEGQFASYVYVPIDIGIDGIRELSKIVEQALKIMIQSEPLIHPIIEESKESSTKEACDYELHISLSRPVYLFHHQRDILKQSVKAMASSQKTFLGSFASFTAFENDERTRAFIAMEIGAGHSELRQLVDCMAPTLRSLYQKEYYSQPRFHASIAWALLKTEPKSVESSPSLSDLEVSVRNNIEYPTLPSISPNIITTLNKSLGDQLSRISFTVDAVKLRIGKQISTYPLQ